MFENQYVLSSSDLYKSLDSPKNKTINSKALGTINYMSPEIIRGDTENGEGDYWSLGVILYIIFTRSHPFDSISGSGNTEETILDNIILNQINWAKLEKTDMTSELFDLVQKFLTYDKKDRLCDLNKIKQHCYFKGIIIL